MDDDVIAAQTGMLIRRPVAEVFEAAVDPAVTTKLVHAQHRETRIRQECLRREWET